MIQDRTRLKDIPTQQRCRYRWIIALLLLLLSGFSGINVIAATQDPDPLRWHKEIKRFAWQDAKNSYPEQAILFIGSSSIYSWKTAQAFPRLPIINRGLSGSHISDIIYYFQPLVRQYHPAKIICYCGENDVAAGKNVTQVLADFKLFSSRIKKQLPETVLLFLAIKPNPLRWSRWGEMAKTNRAIRNYCNSSGLCLFLDTATPLLNADRQRPDEKLFAEDGLHLNLAGYAVWNRILSPYLTMDSKE